MHISEVFSHFYYFWDALILQGYFLITKIDNFRRDLRDISAKTATLVHMPSSVVILADISVRSP